MVAVFFLFLLPAAPARDFGVARFLGVKGSLLAGHTRLPWDPLH